MRIFVAIEINDKNVLDSISKIQSELKINAKPVKIQNLHFTVQFLGEVSEQMVEKISWKVFLETLYLLKQTSLNFLPK